MSCTIYRSTRKSYVSDAFIRTMVSAVLSKMKEPDAAISIHAIGDKKMRALNRTYRGKDATTDVLAFAIQEGTKVFASNDRGDVFLCMPQVARQARVYGVSFKEECARMLIHGLLHIYGYDHEHPKDAKKMFTLQEQFVTSLVR